MKLSIIIPVFNEKDNILKILDKINRVNLGKIKKEIILVDDFSTDGTKEILEKLRNKYTVLFHKRNLGKGYAIRHGLERVTGDIVLIQDADLEYDPEDYPKLIKPILDGKAEVVYGSRRLNKGNRQYSKLSFLLGGEVLTWLANLFYGTKITDEATCYKVFRADVIKGIDMRCKRFEFCPEITAKVAKEGIKIMEVPIKYYPRSADEGKKIKWRDGFEAMWTLLKYKFVD